MSVEIVPSVWPGVMYSVSVVSPSVSFMPSVATMSRFGLGSLLLSSRSQSAADRMTRAPKWSCRNFAPPEWSKWPWLTIDVLDRRRIEPELLQPADDFVFDRVVEDGVDDDDALPTSSTAQAEYSVWPTK